MAEKIVSPGVFTREKDLSFLPQGIGEIGAVVIGPTIKGPAFLPTVVESFADFEIKFGGVSEKTYVPYTVQQYLNSAGRVTIVRVLGLDGYKVDNLILTDGNDKALAVFAPSAAGSDLSLFKQNESSITVDGIGNFNLKVSGSGIALTAYSASTNSTSDTFIGIFISFG